MDLITKDGNLRFSIDSAEDFDDEEIVRLDPGIDPDQVYLAVWVATPHGTHHLSHLISPEQLADALATAGLVNTQNDDGNR